MRQGTSLDNGHPERTSRSARRGRTDRARRRARRARSALFYAVTVVKIGPAASMALEPWQRGDGAGRRTSRTARPPRPASIFVVGMVGMRRCRRAALPTCSARSPATAARRSAAEQAPAGDRSTGAITRPLRCQYGNGPRAGASGRLSARSSRSSARSATVNYPRRTTDRPATTGHGDLQRHARGDRRLLQQDRRASASPSRRWSPARRSKCRSLFFVDPAIAERCEIDERPYDHAFLYLLPA